MATEKEKSPTKVVTGKVRLSYAHLFEKYAAEDGGEPKYSVCVLIPKSDKATLKAINDATEAAKIIGRDKKWGNKIPAKLKLPLRDGDEEKADKDGYVGHYFFNCSCDNPPGVLKKNDALKVLEKVTDATEVYSGCYARVDVNFFPFTGKQNGIGAGLNNVLKVADGEPFGSASDPNVAFADVWEDASSEEAEDDPLS